MNVYNQNRSYASGWGKGYYDKEHLEIPCKMKQAEGLNCGEKMSNQIAIGCSISYWKFRFNWKIYQYRSSVIIGLSVHLFLFFPSGFRLWCTWEVYRVWQWSFWRLNCNQVQASIFLPHEENNPEIRLKEYVNVDC